MKIKLYITICFDMIILRMFYFYFFKIVIMTYLMYNTILNYKFDNILQKII